MLHVSSHVKCLIRSSLFIYPVSAVTPSTAAAIPYSDVSPPPVASKPVTPVITTVASAPSSQAAVMGTAGSTSVGRVKLVSASWDKTVKIWDINASSGQFENTSTLAGHTKVGSQLPYECTYL